MTNTQYSNILFRHLDLVFGYYLGQLEIRSIRNY